MRGKSLKPRGRNQPTVIMTGDEFTNGSIPVREVWED